MECVDYGSAALGLMSRKLNPHLPAIGFQLESAHTHTDC